MGVLRRSLGLECSRRQSQVGEAGRESLGVRGEGQTPGERRKSAAGLR